MYEPLETPLRDHLTADLPVVADFRDLDGSTYHELRLIIKRSEDGHAGIYCLERDWNRTMAANLAYYLQVVQSLIAQTATQANHIDELAHDREQLLADSLKQQTLVETAVRLSAENDALRVAIAVLQAEVQRLTSGLVEIRESHNTETIDHPGPDEPTVPCRYGCGASFHSHSGRGSHEKKVHGAVWQDAPAPAPTPLAGEWRCQICYSNAHAQSVSHPDRCIRCAKQSHNGSYIKLEAAA